MTTDALAISVRGLSDRAALELARLFGEELRVERNIPAMLATAPLEFNESQAAANWIRVGAAERSEPLAPDMAIAGAWTMLEAGLVRPTLRPALERANTDFRFDDAGPPSWITRGLMGLFSLVAATDATDGPQLAAARRQQEFLTTPESVHFLDAVPFDLARPESRSFYDALMRKYSLPNDINRVLALAGIDSAHIVGASSAELWLSALRLAANRRRFRALANAVLRDDRAQAIRDELAALTGPEPLSSDDLPALPKDPPAQWAPWLMARNYKASDPAASRFVDICSVAFPRRGSADLVCAYAGLTLLGVSEALAIAEQWKKIVPLSFTQERQNQLAWQVLCAPDTEGWRREMRAIVGV